MKPLSEKYEKIAKQYIKKFAKKQHLDFDYWIGDTVGSVASFDESYYIDFLDIKHDIDTEQPEYQIMEWYDGITPENRINYKSYCLGLRPRHIQDAEREADLQRCKENVEFARQELMNAVADAMMEDRKNSFVKTC